MAVWQIGQPLQAADQTWTAGTATDFSWDNASNWSAAAPTIADSAILPLLIPNPGALASPSVLTLGALSTANLVNFKNNYTLNSGTLTLGAGGLQADLGTSSVINSILAGTNGLTKTGGGSVRLTNAANSYTGATSIRNGSLIINSEAALGGTGTVSILTTNNTPSNVNLIGFGGGSLVLDGTAGGFTFSRSVNFEGRGPIGDRGSAIQSLGNNTLSGTLTSGVSPLTPATIRNSRINSVNGTMTLSGTVVANGTALANFLILGGVNSSVVGDFDLTGVLSGTGTIEKNGSGTLFLNPSNATGFTGNIRIGASAVGQQSTVRVTQTGVFGASTVSGTSRNSMNLNGGVLEFRNDGSLNFGALAGGRNVSLTASSTIYTGPAAGGQGVNQVTTLGTFRLSDNQTATFASRNGYGVTLGAWTQETTGNNNTITSNMGGTLTFTSSAWSNGDAAARTLTISGTGNTLIQGDLLSSGTGTATKSLIKAGTGLLSLQGTAGTLTGNVSVQQGNLAITDFRSINMHTASGTANTGTINLGSANQGNLFIGIPGTTATAAGLSTSKALALVGTAGGASIIANQTGVNPVIFNATSFTVSGTAASGGAKTLTLGGTNTAENIINSTIPNGPVSGATTLLAATSTSSAVISLNSVAGLTVGDAISGSGFQVGTTISAIDPVARTVTLSLIPTASTASGQTITSANLVAPLSITKVGGGTWALSGTAGANTFTGPVTLAGGTLRLRANAATSTIIQDSVPVRFDASNGFAGATLEFAGQASTTNVETLGQLTLTQGANTLQLTPGASGGNASIVFASLNPTIGDGGTINVLGSTATSTVTLTGVASGLVAPHIHIGGSNFARSNSGVLVAPVYGTDATFVPAPAGANLPGGQNNFSIDGNITAAVTGTASTLKFNGGQSLTLAAAQTLTIRTGAAGTDGGILATGGASSISGGTGITTGGGGALIIRVNGSGDSLTINSPITSTSTGGWTKSGAGTLTLTSTASANTGTVTINEGTVRLSGTGSRLAAANATLTVRQGGILDLNGVTPGTATGQFNNLGTVTSTAGPATFTIGGTNSTGTSYGIIAGQISVIKTGTGAQSWLGSSTYTGSTTIGSTGLVTVDTLADGGTASGIGASTADAANLVFNGSTGGLVYQGNIVDGTDNFASGSRSASTNRLFTLAGTATGATISSNASNNNALVWTSTGPIVNSTTAPATLIFGGTSLGDNTFAPQLADSTLAQALGVNKTGAGQWNLANSANSYTGITRVTEGVLAVNNAGALPANSPLVLGTAATSGIFQTSGTFARTLTTTPTAGLGGINFGGTGGGGGFAAHGGPLTVTLNTGAGLTWGSGGFVPTGAALILNSASALDDVTFTNAIDLGAAARTVTVNDNGTTGADYATLSGVLSGAGGGLFKNGTGILRVGNANSYTGVTSVDAGTLVVTSLGSSTGGATSSVGAGGVTMNDGNAIVLGNATTTGGNLVYVGAGETSDRKIRLRGTTANNTIHADGSGPLILTNVAHDTTETGNKTLNLRGSNADGNAITNVLTDNLTGVLSVTVDGGATWILSGANTYTGNTTASAGALGLGNNAALGTVGTLVLNNGNVFASGGDRTIANAVTHNNNTTAGFLGDYNLTFSQPLNLAAAANNVTTINSVVAGKAVTFNGGVTANAMTANRAWVLDGPGETVINGNFTTSTAFGVRFDVNGNGTLTFGTNGAASNFNQSIAFADIDRGTIKFTTNEAINSSAPTAGGLIMSPESVNSDTATLNLNGTTQTITSLTATSDGAVVIDNTSGTAATLRFGANDNVVNFNPATTGARTITNSGTGALSIVKLGSTTTTFNSGMTLTYKGTTSVEAGSLVINSDVNGTSGLNVSGTASNLSIAGLLTSPGLAISVAGSGSNVSLSGGINSPALITSVNVGSGSSLRLLDNAGSDISALNSLTLGQTGGTITDLFFNVGDGATDKFTLASGATLNLFTGNQIRFNVTDTGLSENTQYVLIDATAIGGGLFGGSSPLTISDWLLGAIGGFTSVDLTTNSTTNQIILTTGSLITESTYWTAGGAADDWNDLTNWAKTNKDGLTAATSTPGPGSDVKFIADSLTGGAAITTALQGNFKVKSLTFEASTAALNTPGSVTINAGALSTNTLEVTGGGVAITAGGSPSVTIASPFRIGAAQNWNVADSGSGLTFSGGLAGTADVTKIGAGRVLVSAAADAALFNPGGTVDINVNAGVFEIGNVGALGTTANGNAARVNLNGGAFYTSTGTAAAATVNNALDFNGGTLSVNGTAATYNGTVAVTSTSGSTINMRDANSAVTTTTARTITLSGVVSGAGTLNVDSIDTVTTGNQLGTILTMNNGSSTWNGTLGLTRGTVVFTNAANAGNATPYFGYSGAINFNQFGRVIIRNIDGGALSRSGAITFASSATGEFVVDNMATALASNYTVTQSGLVSLGGTSVARFRMEDVASNLILSGGVNLNGNASFTVTGGDADSLLTISGTGFTGTGDLALNDESGAWGVTSGRIAINAPSTFTGNTTFSEGTLILGNKTALSTGSLTLAGAASTIEASADLSGANAIANAFNLGQNLTTSGTNNLTFSGIATNSVDANRQITNNIVTPSVLTFSGTTFNLAPASSTAARTLTITGTGNTLISAALVNGGAGASVLQKLGTGTLTLSATGNAYTGGTNINLGTLTLGASNVLPGTGAVTVSATSTGSAILNLDGFSDTIGALNLGGTGGVVGSVNQVTTGAGTLTLGGNVTVTSTGNWTSPALISGTLALGGTSRTFTVNNSNGTDVDLDLQATVTGTSGNSVTKAGAGVMLMTSTGGTWGGGTVVSAGEIRLGASNVIPNTGTVTLNGGGSSILNLNGFSDTIAALTLGGTGNGAGSVYQVNTGAGTLTLGGTVTVSSTANAVGSVISGNVALGASRTFAVSDSPAAVDLDLTAAVTGTATASFTKTGAGVLAISSTANSWGGGTVVSAGELRSGASNVIPDAGTVTLNGSGSSILNLNGFSDTIGILTLGGTGNAAGSVYQVNTGAGTLTLGGTLSVTSTANAVGSTISGNLDLGGNRTISVADSPASADLTVSALVSGAFTLTKTGSGALLLSNASNSYTGATTISGGIMSIAADGALGTAPVTPTAGHLTLNGGGLNTSANLTLATNRGVTLGASGGALLPNLGTTLTINSAIDGVGGLTLNGTGGDLVLSGAGSNTYAGVTTVTAGALTLSKSGGALAIANPAVGSKVTANILVNGGSLIWGGNDQIGDNSFINVTSGTVNFNNRNETLFNLANSGGSINYGTGDITIEDPTWSAGSNTVSGNTTFGFLDISGGTNNVTGTSGGGAGQLTIGTGTTSGPLTFSGSNNTPTLNLNSDDTTAGRLRFRAGSSIELQFTGTGTSTGLIASTGVGANAGEVDLNGSTRTFNIGDAAGSAVDMTISAKIVGTGAGITKTGAGTLSLSGNNTYDGGTNLNAGVVQVNSAGALGSTGTISFGGGTLQYTAANTTDYSARFSTAASQAISIDTNGQNVTFASNLTSSGGNLAKTGVGTLELTGDNTYDLGTTVGAGGALLINNTTGSATGTGNVTTPTLGGSGSIVSSATSASVVVQNILNVGNVGDIGGQDLAINLTGGSSSINLSGAALNFDLWTDFTSGAANAFPASDLLNLNAGSIDITGGTLNVSALANIGNTWAFNTTWQLFNWNAVTPTGTFSSLNLPDLTSWDALAEWDTTNLYTTGTIQVILVPEPSRAMLLLLGLLSLGFRRRRNRF
jgi:autotransporter-associated beta strand protein